MSADTTSLKSTGSKVRTPGAEPAGKRVGFARPTLVIPPPQLHRQFGPYSAGSYPGQAPYTPGSVHTMSSMGMPKPYGRKASMFMNRQFVGLRDFTMNTAKSGLGIGEKCSVWCYGKVKHLSKRWFTHCFLSIVITLYTVGGALLFVYIEGSNEDAIKEKYLHDDRYSLIRTLRNLSIIMPEKTSVQEWEGKASLLVKEYEDKIIEYYQSDTLIMTNRGNKIWTLWNAIVYCATVYTTLGQNWWRQKLGILKVLQS
ncbi:unnamed protein product [Phyllotreta striolata]|uniref:Uncharacterized protein n=1 Tax=Phyllotreta striolata TaxID=444603 RepID=A0A9N9TSL4_PHYSR|nr:unnamed protein product [Phyllotreta striolata]